MASLEASARMRGEAVEKFTDAMQRISGALGVEAADLRVKAPDRFTKDAILMGRFADWAESVAAALENRTETDANGVKDTDEGADTATTELPQIDAEVAAAANDYTSMTVSELAALIEERGLTLPESGSGAHGAIVKQDYIDVLSAADGEES